MDDFIITPIETDGKVRRLDVADLINARSNIIYYLKHMNYLNVLAGVNTAGVPYNRETTVSAQHLTENVFEFQQQNLQSNLKICFEQKYLSTFP